jgi:hypothetical protein
MTDDSEFRRQLEFLIKDANTAHDDKDHDTAAFSLLQIFKLSEKRNKTRPPPTEEQVAAFEDMLRDMMRKTGATSKQLMQVMNHIYERFGEKPPIPPEEFK